MAELVDIPTLPEALTQIKYKVGKMLQELFPDHELRPPYDKRPLPTTKYISLEYSNISTLNPQPFNITPVFYELLEDGTENYVYSVKQPYRLYFHKDNALGEAMLLKMMLDNKQFWYTHFGSDDTIGVTEIRTPQIRDILLDFVELEEGAFLDITINFIFKVINTGMEGINEIYFSVTSGDDVREDMVTN